MLIFNLARQLYTLTVDAYLKMCPNKQNKSHQIGFQYNIKGIDSTFETMVKKVKEKNIYDKNHRRT